VYTVVKSDKQGVASPVSSQADPIGQTIADGFGTSARAVQSYPLSQTKEPEFSM